MLPLRLFTFLLQEFLQHDFAAFPATPLLHGSPAWPA